MKWLRRWLCPTDKWEPIADRLGGEYVQGSALASSEIRLQHGTLPITVISKTGESQNDHTECTYVTTEAPLRSGLKIALYRNLPGSRFMGALVSMTGKSVDIPALGEQVTILAENPAVAEQVLGDPAIAGAMRPAPDRIQILIGGISLREWDQPTSNEVSVLTRGVVADPEQLLSMVDLMRVLLDVLGEADCLET